MDTKRFNDYIQKIPTDIKALIPIYEEYYTKIVVHISYKFNKKIAEDVAQDFFKDLMQIKENHDYIDYPTSWVYKCCDYIALKHLSCESGYVELKEEYLASNMFAATEINIDLIDEIMQLEELSQKILFHFYWEGYSQEEIAQMLKLRPATVRQKHHRAIKKLKKLL